MAAHAHQPSFLPAPRTAALYALALGALASPSPAHAAGGGNVDQVSPATTANFNVNSNTLVWQQEIQVGLGGRLTGVDLPLTGNAGAQVNVRIRNGAAPAGAAPMFTQLVTKAINGVEVVEVDMNAANMYFVPGNLFVLELQGNNTGAGINGSYGNPTGYPNQLCLNASCPYADGLWRIAFTTFVLACNADGVHDAGEQCDDGNLVAGDGCNNCLLEYCGNGILDPGEVCEDGDVINGDGCSSDCMSDETCGNGVVDFVTGEACDDGNFVDGDGCNSTCGLPGCGDGFVDPGEACDDGNMVGGDGCNPTCTSNETCGNGIVDGIAGEQCDDGGMSPGDGCGPTCLVEACGNGVVDPGELCDEGDVLNGDGCSSDCTSDETCGNGVIDVGVGEACDDGNLTDGDGCTALCALPSCGDGVTDPVEICDDGNNVDGDGCNATCTSDESCGNGIVDGVAGEQCDDGRMGVGDGCGATCLIETCGNGVVDPGEVCDDDNVTNGDGCSSDCMSDESCGNGIIDVAVGEMCDDGDANGDAGPCGTDCAPVDDGGADGTGGESGTEPGTTGADDDSTGGGSSGDDSSGGTGGTAGAADDGGGCSCRSSGPNQRAPWWLLGLGLLGIGRRHRQRRAA